MSEQTDTGDDTEVELPSAEIEFLGRMIFVRMPKPEQILVWQRTLKRLEAADPKSWTGHDVMAAMERVRSIVDSILVSAKDVDWIDDEMLAGRVGFRELAPMMAKAVTAFTVPNREERRAAKKAPAKKATRRAPTKTAAPARARKATS